MRSALALTVFLFAGLSQAGSARAEGALHPLCEEGRPGDEELAEPALHSLPVPAAILPCALLDSGLLQRGLADDATAPGCADTPFYVVTHAGVLLCQVDVELFAGSGVPTLERAPSALPSSTGSGPAALATPGLAALVPPLVEPRPAALCESHLGGPRDATTWRPPRPS